MASLSSLTKRSWKVPHNRSILPLACGEPAKITLRLSLPGEKPGAQQIEQALCFKQKRTVANDNTITFDGILFQIPKRSPYRSYANKRIDVHVLLDGSLELFYKHEKIAAFDSEKTHTLGLYRTNKKLQGFRYGPISNLSTHDQQLSP